MESSAKSQSGGPRPDVNPDSAPGVDLQERFTELHRRTEREVFSFILRRVGDYTTAMELTQETFARVWEARNRYDPSQGGRPWVLRIAANVLVSDHRARSAQKRGGGHTISLEQLSPEDDPEQRRQPA